MCKRNVLKHEWELATRALNSWLLTKALSYYHVTPYLPPLCLFPCLLLWGSCTLLLLQGASYLKTCNQEDFSWVNMNLVTRKSSKLGNCKCCQEKERILKLVQKEKTDQEPGNCCSSSGSTFLIYHCLVLTPIPFSNFNLLGLHIG